MIVEFKPNINRGLNLCNTGTVVISVEVSVLDHFVYMDARQVIPEVPYTFKSQVPFTTF